jgi:hypothetical protein
MKGFTSFALVLAMALILFYFTNTTQTNQLGMEKVKHELMKAEQANKERTLLENNTDKIILEKLKEQIIKKNFNAQQVQNEINSKLAEYLKGKAHTATILREKTGETNPAYLNENTSIMIIKGKTGTYAEYYFTSTITKNTTISAQFGNKIISYFEMPIGYTEKIFLPG